MSIQKLQLILTYIPPKVKFLIKSTHKTCEAELRKYFWKDINGAGGED